MENDNITRAEFSDSVNRESVSRQNIKEQITELKVSMAETKVTLKDVVDRMTQGFSDVEKNFTEVLGKQDKTNGRVRYVEKWMWGIGGGLVLASIIFSLIGKDLWLTIKNGPSLTRDDVRSIISEYITTID